MQLQMILIIVFFLVVLGVAIGLTLSNCRNCQKQNEVCFKENCFSVELAVSAQEKSRGLMFRKKLAEDEGMLFIFKEEGEYSFWMKNTLIPLDIIWINENNQVVYISRNSQPCKDNSCSSINPGSSCSGCCKFKTIRTKATITKIPIKIIVILFI